MSIITRIVDTSPALEEYTPKLIQETERSIKLAEEHLPITHDVAVLLSDNPDEAIEEIGGIGGYTPSAQTVLISLDPDHPYFARALNTELVGIVCHELHHALRWKDPGYGTTLLEALITEGLADHFDLEVTHASPRPWSVALSDAELRDALNKAKPYFNEPYDHETWFFGSDEDEIPRWTGYALGFQLVDRYLKNHPGQKPSELYAKPAQEFIPQE